MARLTVLVLCAAFAGSCSLTEYHHDQCTGPAGCRAAFGFASVCGGDGLCTPAGTTSPRCRHTFPSDLYARPTDYRDWLVMGAILNENDPSDQASENAITLAAQQVNDLGGLGVNGPPPGDGGVAGIKFAVVFCTAEEDRSLDTLTSDAAAADDAVYLAHDLGLPIILGPTTSIQAEAAYHALFPMPTALPHPTGPVFISHSATSPALTDDDAVLGLFWRTVPPDSLQGRVIGQDIMTRHATGGRVAEIFETGPYGLGLQQAFEASFAGSKTPISFEAGNATRRDNAVLTVGMQASSYDEVLFISSDFMDEPAFLTYASSLGSYAPLDIFLTDTAGSSPSFLTASGMASTLFPRVRGTRFAAASGTVYDQFAASYSAAFMSAPDVRQYQYAPTAYDAAWLAFIGASWALHQTPTGEITGAAVSDGLRKISSPRATPQDLLPGHWAAIDAAFAAHPPAELNVNGASGALEYDPRTEETTGPVEVWRIDTTTGAPTIVVDHVVTP